MGRQLQCGDVLAPLQPFLFSLLRSAIAYVRVPRSSIGHFHHAPPLDLIQVESNVITNFDNIAKCSMFTL